MGGKQSSGIWNARYLLLLVIEFLLQIGLSVTRPIVSMYALSLGSSVGVAGALSGMLAISALAMRPVSGQVVDKIDKPTLLVISCAVFVSSVFGIILSRNIVLLGVFLFVQGFAFAIKSSIVIVLAADAVPDGNVGASIGWMSLAYTASQALGPMLGSAVGTQFGYGVSFTLSACFLSVGFVLALRYSFSYPEGSPRKEIESRFPDGEQSVETNKGAFSFVYSPALPLSLVAGLLMVSQGTMTGFVVYIGDARGIDHPSIYFLCYAIANLFARPLAGKFSDTHSASFVVKPMLIVSVGAVLCLAYANGIIGIMLSGLLLGIGQGSTYSVLQAESIRNVPASESGRAANTFYIGPDIGMGFGPAIIGSVIQVWGITTGLLVCACLTVLSLTLFSVYWAKGHKNQ